MKLKLYIFALLALSVISCTREPLPELEREEGKIVTISASIPPETRVVYDDADRSLTWQTGDTLLLAGYDGTTYKGSEKFHWTGGKNFQGTEVPGATTYKAYYLAKGIMLDETTGDVQLPDNFWEQTQDGDNSTAHLRNKLLLFDEDAQPITQTFNLALKSSIIRFRLKGVHVNVGTLNNLIWKVQTTSKDTKSMTLNLTDLTISSALDSITAFLAFDPTVMKIAANGKARISLHGGQSYVFWETTVSSAKDYLAGNRYTGTVNNGWKDIKHPLSYVAEYNVSTDGTNFTWNPTDCTVSGYFNWNGARDINISGYHLPSIGEWQSIIPPATKYVRFTKVSSFNGITENVIVQGENIAMTSDFRTTADSISYALRYKETCLVSAWRYEIINYDTDNFHMEVTSRNVAPSITIDDIANENFWNSGQEDDIVRCFPASGSMSGNYFPYRRREGYFWSATGRDVDYAWGMNFTYRTTYAEYVEWKTSNLSVRLFYN